MKFPTNKYHNRKVERNGIKYDSEKEANRHWELQLLERGKQIEELEYHKRFIILDKGVNNFGEKWIKITYEADFYYFDVKNGCYVCEDSKGFRTDVYQLKRKMFMARYPHIKFIES